jgi:hypothetical protein
MMRADARKGRSDMLTLPLHFILKLTLSSGHARLAIKHPFDEQLKIATPLITPTTFCPLGDPRT